MNNVPKWSIVISLLLLSLLSKVSADTAWLPTSSLNTSRITPSVFASNGFLFAIAGDPTSQDYEYASTNTDGTLGSWTFLTGDTYFGYDGLGSVAVGSTIYLLGGRGLDYGSYDYFGSCYRATITPSGALSSFVTDSNNLNLARSHFATVYCNGYLYVLGGIVCDFEIVVCFDGFTNTVEFSQVSSDGSLGPWNYTSSLSSNAGMMYGGWASGSSIYVMGNVGVIEKADQNPDGTLGNWQLVSDTVPDLGPMVLTQDSFVYVIGNGGNVYKAIFDPTTQTIGAWAIDTRAVVVPRFNHSAAAVGSNLYVVGGQQSLDSTDTLVVEYTGNTYQLIPFAGFYSSETGGISPLLVNFYDTSANNPTQWNWDFGDGGTSTAQNPSHLYSIITSPTTYTVRLIISNDYSSSTSLITNYIYVTTTSLWTTPSISNLPSLKLFTGQSLDSAFNIEDFNSGSVGTLYSIPQNFLSLSALAGSTVNQNQYGSVTVGTNTYQIINPSGSSSCNNEVKYSTYKIYELPKVGLTAGSSWDVNMANYTYNSSGLAIPPSFGNAAALIVSDTTMINATWVGDTIIEITSLQASTGAVSVDVIASPSSAPPYNDFDKERIWVYSNLLSNGTFAASSDTIVWSPLEMAPGQNVMATQQWLASYTDSAGTQANGVWQFTFANASSGIKSTPKVSNWIPMSSNQWYTVRMRVVADMPNSHQAILLGYNNVPGAGLQTDVATDILFGIPSIWTWMETPLLVHGTSTGGYPQFQFKAGGAGSVYIDEIQIINATPTLVDSGRYITGIGYPYGEFNQASDTTGWGQQIYSGASSAPAVSVNNGELILDFSGATTGNGEKGIKWTANNGFSGQGAATFSATQGRQVGVRATLGTLSGTINSLGIMLVAGYGVQSSGQQDIGIPPSNLFACAGVGILLDGYYYTVADAINPFYQFQFGVRCDQQVILSITDVDFLRDQDDPNYADPTLFYN